MDNHGSQLLNSFVMSRCRPTALFAFLTFLAGAKAVFVAAVTVLPAFLAFRARNKMNGHFDEKTRVLGKDNPKPELLSEKNITSILEIQFRFFEFLKTSQIDSTHRSEHLILNE